MKLWSSSMHPQCFAQRIHEDEPQLVGDGGEFCSTLVRCFAAYNEVYCRTIIYNCMFRMSVQEYCMSDAAVLIFFPVV